MTQIARLVGWVPLCPLNGFTNLGILGGRLAVANAHGRHSLEPDNLTGLLPLLERPFATFLAELEQREAELKLEPGTLRRWVPWPSVIRLASSQPSEYWPELALRWIEDMPVEDRDEVALMSIATTRTFPQSLRHRALRLLRTGTTGS